MHGELFPGPKFSFLGAELGGGWSRRKTGTAVRDGEEGVSAKDLRSV